MIYMNDNQDEISNLEAKDGICNDVTHQVMVGSVPIGGGAPVAVQSMLNASSKDVGANLDQIFELQEAGCEIIRMAIPSREDLHAFETVCARSPLPVVADIHFDPRIAVEAAWRGASKLRINPGNIGGLDKCDPIIDAARGAGIPIRIGVNAGSLDSDIAENSDLSMAQKLSYSAAQYARYFEDERGFTDLVVSAKAHDVVTTLETYRLLHDQISHIPLHIGVTEAGTAFQGLIKSAAAIGILLDAGIGDTLRISLTEDPALEVQAAWQLLSALGLRKRGVEIVSCPTCGRCKVDMIPIAKEVERRLVDISSPLKVAVMGCVVNGPGEAKDCDVGVACGEGQGAIFRNGKIIRKVAESEIIDALMDEIEDLK